MLHNGHRAGGTRIAAEVTTLVGAAVAYFAVRELVQGSTPAALGNARHVLRLEDRLHIDVERSIQHFVLAHDWLVKLGNHAYVWLHWPFLIAAFAWLLARDTDRFQLLRDSLIVSGLAGVAIFAAFPVAPPRALPGFVGTVSQAERQHFLPFPSSWQNPYASTPSFHAAWTFLAAALIAPSFKHRGARLLALLPGPLVTIAVITTGNHFVFDVVVGFTITLVAYAIALQQHHRPQARRPAPPLAAAIHLWHRALARRP